MAEHIQAVKDQIENIVRRVRDSYPQLKMNLGFLGYRDMCDGDRQFEKLLFSEDVSKFKNFLAGIKAHGGGDIPEDIAGAAQQAIGWSWMRPVKVLFHIADSPCHGKKYHDVDRDDYPEGTSVSIAEQMRGLRKIGVDYYFGRITGLTDKMITKLNEELGVDTDNSMYITAVSIDDPVQIQAAVAQSVCTSISLSELHAAAIPRLQQAEENVVISEKQPEWDLLEAGEKKHGQLQATNVPDSFESLQHLPKWITSDVYFNVAPHPFGQGEHRLCYWGVYRESDQQTWTPGVFKKFKRTANASRSANLQKYRDQILQSFVAEFFAQKFSKAKLKHPQNIQFLLPNLIEDLSGTSGTYWSVEPVLPNGTVKKYNDNKSVWNPKFYHQMLGDFTKWTYEFSSHEYMVVDLQGVEVDQTFVMTDPAILHPDLNRFGDTNTGPMFMEETLKNIPKVALRARL
eukprot:gnl/TRDRNA2_/TRDRNA2_87575_c1_seq1.p1 gnl/TRDRNA2_/TRDRNA2_87575_c1~~gnl/TRDRNA2_/TRDRNA2_87575_c1_seq1.p1  ORF type:complete len:480 (-),score=91.59 gnl/TRDRNA2_/TRDRNA2_87575_c1_seq1:52-1422(-)